MKKVLQMFLFIALLTTYSCKEVIDSPHGTCDVEKVNYVGRYVSYYGSPSELNLAVANFDTLFVVSGYPELSVPKDESTQNRIAKYFNDSNYKAVFPVKNECPYSTNMTCVVSSDSISSIEIISDKDFDATHPAGTNLSDLFHFRGFSVEKFIKSNYDTNISELKVLYDWFEKDRGDKILMLPDRYLTAMYNSPGEGKSYLYPITLRADEVNFNNSKLLGEYLTLYTRVKPLVKGEHNIVVKFRFSNKELSKSLVADFDKVETNNKTIFYQSHSMKYGRNLSFLLK